MLAAGAAGTAGLARAAFFFLFEPTNVRPGEVAVVRVGGTPAGFTLDQRERPFQPALRVYLVPRSIAGTVRSPSDRRLHFIGVLVPDRWGRGLLPFRVPPVDSGEYTAARWCRTCRTGRTFYVGAAGPDTALPDAERTLLHVDLPSARRTCPATKGRGRAETYGNGLLSTRVSSIGTLIVQREAGGRLSTKLGWLPHKGLRGELVVRGERLDAPGRMRVLGVYWGHASRGPAARGGWASAVEFPSEGCWRISGRVRDVSLTYVARVIGR